jgi:hypothetical protein
MPNKYLQAKKAAKDARLKAYIGARILGSCRRRLYFELIRAYQVPPSKSLLKLWKRGSMAEVIAIEELAKVGVPVVNQQKMLTNKSAKVRGKIDGEFGSSVIEIKSAATGKYDRLRESLDMSEYRDQTLFYLHEGRYEEALVVVIDRDEAIDQNNRRFFSVVITPDFDRYKFLLDRALLLRRDAEIDAIPPADYEAQSSYECSFCPYRVPCGLSGE